LTETFIRGEANVSNFSGCASSSVAFLLQEEGAREKLAKENADIGISPSAEGEEACAASTAQAFEKA